MTTAEDLWLLGCADERMDALREDLYRPVRREFHLDRYRAAAIPVATKSVQGLPWCVLDCACGTGYGCEVLRRAGTDSIVGADACPEAIAYARQHYEKRGTRFQVSKAEDFCLLPPDRPFDLICCFETLEHLVNDRQALHAFYDAGVPGAGLFVSVPNKGSACGKHRRSYSPESLYILVSSSGFRVRYILAQNSGDREREENHGKPRGFSDDLKNAESLFLYAEATSI